MHGNRTNPNCFKACDMFGRVPDELNGTLARGTGGAMADQLGTGPIALGRGGRLLSAATQAALTDGSHRAGRNGFFNVELSDTQEEYFQTAHLGAVGGILVTGSSSLIDHSGMKLPREGARPASGDSGPSAIRDFAAGDQAPIPASLVATRVILGKSAYIVHLLGHADENKAQTPENRTNTGNGGGRADAGHMH